MMLMMSCGGPSRPWKRFVIGTFAIQSPRAEWHEYEQSGKAHERSADQLRDELETLRQKLELVLGTEPGVIEQYERRKEEVCSVVLRFKCDVFFSALTSAQIASLSKKIEERNKQAAKIEKSIKVAKVSTPIYASR
jgi:hypothetical protein